MNAKMKMLAANVPLSMYKRFSSIARRNERSVSGELRLLVQRHIESFDNEDSRPGVNGSAVATTREGSADDRSTF